MTDKINLTTLREQANDPTRWSDLGYVLIDPDDLLALIDTAEAAIAYDRTNGESVDADTDAYIRLRETLNHYTTQ